MRRISPPPDFSFCCLVPCSYLIHICFFDFIFLHLVFLSLITTQHILPVGCFCSLFVLYPYFLSWLSWLLLFVLHCTTNTAQISRLCVGIFVLVFFSFVLSFWSILYLYLLCPYVTNSSTTHNTNIHAPGGIPTRNPSKRSAADPRLRPLGHWDLRGFDPRTVQLYQAAVPTELFWPTTHMCIYIYIYIYVCVTFRISAFRKVTAVDVLVWIGNTDKYGIYST